MKLKDLANTVLIGALSFVVVPTAEALTTTDYHELHDQDPERAEDYFFGFLKRLEAKMRAGNEAEFAEFIRKVRVGELPGQNPRYSGVEEMSSLIWHDNMAFERGELDKDPHIERIMFAYLLKSFEIYQEGNYPTEFVEREENEQRRAPSGPSVVQK